MLKAGIVRIQLCYTVVKWLSSNKFLCTPMSDARMLFPWRMRVFPAS